LTVNKLSYPDDIYPREALQPERSYFKTSFNPNGHNFSAEYYLAYDRENLYIAVKADDREHLNRVANSYLWEGDSIQWVLSGKDIPPAAIRPTTMKQQDYISLDNYGLALTGKGIRYCKHLGKSGFRNFPANVTRKDGITFYEVAVPWSDTGITPFAGQSVRFSLVIFNKVKEADAGSAYYLALTPGVAGGMDAGCYRLLIFDK
jgi:hypothetical protein